ncbi:MAG: hypothetical protein RL365_2237 [Bacteroidota bacterium]|jgi:hypothetical protein
MIYEHLSFKKHNGIHVTKKPPRGMAFNLKQSKVMLSTAWRNQLVLVLPHIAKNMYR